MQSAASSGQAAHDEVAKFEHYSHWFLYTGDCELLTAYNPAPYWTHDNV